MPLYDYRCTECGREVEVMHGIHERGPDRCEHCDGAMRKTLSLPAIHFKGSGWAKKDAATKVKPKKSSPAEGKETTVDAPAAASGKDKPASVGANSKDSSAGKGDSFL